MVLRAGKKFSGPKRRCGDEARTTFTSSANQLASRPALQCARRDMRACGGWEGDLHSAESQAVFLVPLFDPEPQVVVARHLRERHAQNLAGTGTGTAAGQ